jgi:spore coat protein U-like protein
MNHVLFRCCAALLLIGLGLFWHRPAQAAITCTITATPNVSFGSVNPLSSNPTDQTGSLSYTCSNNDILLGYAATLCFNVGPSSNGATNPRQMQDTAGDALNYQLYQDSTRSTVWGSQYGPPSAKMVNISLAPTFFGPPTTVSGTLTVYGRLFGNQTSALPGPYADSFTGATAQLTINQVGQFLGIPPPPGTCGGPSGSVNFPFTVQATVTSQCFVSASLLNFGNNVGLLTSAVNATTTLGVQCSNGTSYNVGLDAGLNGGGNINARKMVLGANSVAYQLYQNSGRTTVWGNTVGTNTVAGMGTGNSQSLTVYGTVPAQTTPPAGTYNDTITVTVTY